MTNPVISPFYIVGNSHLYCTTISSHHALLLGSFPVIILAWSKDSQILPMCGIRAPWMIGNVVMQVAFSHLIVFSSLSHR